MRGIATLPQGNQHLLVVRYKVGRPPGELGVSKSMECDIFPSVLWHCWLGDRKGIWPVKKLVVGLLLVMIWLELWMACSSSSPVVTTTSIVLCFNNHRLTQVHLEMAVKTRERMCNCTTKWMDFPDFKCTVFMDSFLAFVAFTVLYALVCSNCIHCSRRTVICRFGAVAARVCFWFSLLVNCNAKSCNQPTK